MEEEHVFSCFGSLTMQPKWDLLHQLLNYQASLKMRAQWIKSHQDNDTEYKNLSFQAKLNAHAGKLSTAQHDKLAQGNMTRIPKLPWVPIQLLCNKEKL